MVGPTLIGLQLEVSFSPPYITVRAACSYAYFTRRSKDECDRAGVYNLDVWHDDDRTSSDGLRREFCVQKFTGE